MVPSTTQAPEKDSDFHNVRPTFQPESPKEILLAAEYDRIKAIYSLLDRDVRQLGGDVAECSAKLVGMLSKFSKRENSEGYVKAPPVQHLGNGIIPSDYGQDRPGYASK